MKRTAFTVRGSYPFPLDMLRYDSCIPATEADAALMHEAVLGDGPGDPLRVMEISLVTFRPDCAPSNDRWESRGWSVTREEACR